MRENETAQQHNLYASASASSAHENFHRKSHSEMLTDDSARNGWVLGITSDTYWERISLNQLTFRTAWGSIFFLHQALSNYFW